jgi:hypothetical protein
LNKKINANNNKNEKEINMSIGDKYIIDEKWEEGVKHGWNCYIVKDNGNLISKKKVDPVLMEFVENKMPELFEDFYQSIIDGIADAGGDPDSAVEFCEELLGPNLGESLVWFAGWVKPELIRKDK